MPTVHIVGGGVAGLALAAGLPPDWRVHLHEQRWGRRSVPTLFGLQRTGREALAELGVGHELRDASIEVSSARALDDDGAVLSAASGVDVQLVPRTTMVDMLRGRLPKSVQVHRHRVLDLAQLRNSADRSWEDRTLVVAADGVHSVVRASLWGARSAPRLTGATAVRGVIPGDPAQAEPAGLEETWGPGGLFGVTPRPGGGANWFATLPRRPFADTREALDTLRGRWAQARSIRSVLDRALPDDTLVNDLWESRLPLGLTRRGPDDSRCVLIGDAAHAMTPNLGRGAQEALQDAVVLGQALREHGLDAGLRAYSRRRTAQPQLVRAASGAVLRIATTRRTRLRRLLMAPLPP